MLVVLALLPCQKTDLLAKFLLKFVDFVVFCRPKFCRQIDKRFLSTNRQRQTTNAYSNWGTCSHAPPYIHKKSFWKTFLKTSFFLNHCGTIKSFINIHDLILLIWLQNSGHWLWYVYIALNLLSDYLRNWAKRNLRRRSNLRLQR